MRLPFIQKKMGLTLLAFCLFALSAMAQPTLSVSFNSNTIGPGNISTMTFLIDNSASGSPVTGLAFTNTLNGNVTIADPAIASTTCLDGGSGSLSAPNGGGTITLSDYQVPAFQTCFVVVNVTATTAGAHSNLAVTLSSSAGSSMSLPVDLTVVTTLPGFSKSFAPSSVDLGEVSTLTLTIDNTANAAGVEDLDFTDNLPAGMVVASPNNLSTTCGIAALPPTLTGLSGSSQIILDANGTVVFPALAAGATCTVTVDVVTTGSGDLENVTDELLADGTSAGKATATLEVLRDDPIHMSKSFTNDPAVPGGTVELEFTITNFDRNFDATAINFTDDLTTAFAGLTFSSLTSNSCGGMVTGVGTTDVGLTGGMLGTGLASSCTIRIECTIPGGTAPGEYTNTTSAVGATIDGNAESGNPASGKLFLAFAPTFTKEYQNNPRSPGGTVELVFTITNTDPNNDLTDIEFTDVFPTIIQTASATPSNGDCGGGSMLTFQPLIFNPGDDAIPAKFTLSGGSIPMGASCTFSITLDITAGTPGGIYPNTTSTLTGTVNGDAVEGAAATDDLEVLHAPVIIKNFSEDVVEDRRSGGCDLYLDPGCIGHGRCDRYCLYR